MCVPGQLAGCVEYLNLVNRIHGFIAHASVWPTVWLCRGKNTWPTVFCPACEDGYYGNCSSTCGKCEQNKVCDRATGHCPEGRCEKGFVSPLCAGKTRNYIHNCNNITLSRPHFPEQKDAVNRCLEFAIIIVSTQEWHGFSRDLSRVMRI